MRCFQRAFLAISIIYFSLASTCTAFGANGEYRGSTYPQRLGQFIQALVFPNSSPPKDYVAALDLLGIDAEGQAVLTGLVFGCTFSATFLMGTVLPDRLITFALPGMILGIVNWARYRYETWNLSRTRTPKISRQIRLATIPQ